MKKQTSPWWLSAILFILFFVFSINASLAQKVDLAQLKQLKYRHIGPLGNRLTCVAGVAQDPLTYYVGAASGGIWKTSDAGVNWKAVIDDKPVHSIGAIEVSASDPQVVWAGTGESSIRSNVSVGDGVWKSTDGGTTWNNMGLENTFRVSRLLIHPTNPDVVFVGSLGSCVRATKRQRRFQDYRWWKNLDKSFVCE
jgi:photosystem II stability/assembly factor-like uncharacterized protein